ncbi:MAG TPA: TPM domain-containing protein, partial [Terriglobales bacterium]|nr:TPM domain-containing protein [Terriglobales bacterium]
MRRRTRISAKLYSALPFLATLWILLVAAPQVSAEPIASLQPHNYVNDFAGVLDASTQARLNALCQEVEEKAHAQITVVTVKTTDGEDVFSYAVDLYQKWGIGKKGSDRGVLILNATQDRKLGASVGYGLEPILPDGKIGGFRREAAPYLARADYNAGLTLMTGAIADVIAQDAGVTLSNAARRPVARRQPAPGGAGAVFLVIFILFIVFSILRAIFRGGGGPRGGSGFWSGLLWGMLFSNMGGRGGFGGGGFGGGFGGGGSGGGFGGF